ncbi:MAG: FAD-dependent oxidoreductase [Leptolyngbya sp. BL-A-14]
MREQDILPIHNGCVASLPIVISGQGCLQAENVCDAIAIGNYANDHHYPSGDITLKPKSMRWGGRWTGTPFTIPYRSLVPVKTDGLLACEKNISVSHMANGATRLQPLVLGIGQAAGMAAALCIEQGCQPRELDVRSLQEALLSDTIAPAAVIPLLNSPLHDPDWLYWQHYYLDHPEAYPVDGNCPTRQLKRDRSQSPLVSTKGDSTLQPAVTGIFQRLDEQTYTIEIVEPFTLKTLIVHLVTLDSAINAYLATKDSNQTLTVSGQLNSAGNWFLVETIED